VADALSHLDALIDAAAEAPSLPLNSPPGATVLRSPAQGGAGGLPPPPPPPALLPGALGGERERAEPGHRTLYDTGAGGAQRRPHPHASAHAHAQAASGPLSLASLRELSAMHAATSPQAFDAHSGAGRAPATVPASAAGQSSVAASAQVMRSAPSTLHTSGLGSPTAGLGAPPSDKGAALSNPSLVAAAAAQLQALFPQATGMTAQELAGNPALLAALQQSMHHAMAAAGAGAEASVLRS
jgi:hypothetical protein